MRYFLFLLFLFLSAASYSQSTTSYFEKAQLAKNDTLRLRVAGAMYERATKAFADPQQVSSHEYAALVAQNANNSSYIDHFTRSVLLFNIDNSATDQQIYAVVDQLWPSIVSAWLIQTGRIRIDYSGITPVLVSPPNGN